MSEQFNKCGGWAPFFCTKLFRKAQNPTPVPSGGAVQVPTEAEAEKISA